MRSIKRDNTRDYLESTLVSPSVMETNANNYRSYYSHPSDRFCVQLHRAYIECYKERPSPYRLHWINAGNDVQNIPVSNLFGATPMGHTPESIKLMQAQSYEDPGQKHTKMLKDCVYFLDPNGERKLIKEFGIGEFLYHDCDEEVKDDGLLGIPSAVILPTQKDNRCLYCFACTKTSFILATFERERYKCHKNIIFQRGQRFEQSATAYIKDSPTQNLFVWDWCIGSGKTHNIQSVCKQFPRWNIISITHRIGLARNFAARCDLTCYKDINHNDRLVNKKQYKRLAFCINSFGKIPETLLDTYQMVILDEVEFIKQHLVSATMHDRWPIVLRTLCCILQNSKYIFLLQHWISDSTVRFIADMSGIDLTDRKQVISTRLMIAPTADKTVVRYSENRNDVNFEMIHYLKNKYNKKVVMVYMNNKADVYELHCDLRMR